MTIFNSVLDSGLIVPITTTCVSGKPVNARRGGVVLGGGKITGNPYRPNVTQTPTTAAIIGPFQNWGKMRVMLSVSPTDSGNLGTFEPFSGSSYKFNQIAKKHYIMPLLTDQFAGNTTVPALVKSPGNAGIGYKKNAYFSQGYYNVGVFLYNYVTGIASYTNTTGNLIQFQNPLNGGSAVAVETAGTNAVPGHLTLLITGTIPSNLNYARRNSF